VTANLAAADVAWESAAAVEMLERG
jgi:hypothetical protein